MKDAEDAQAVARSAWRAAFAWALQSRTHTALIALLFLLAGIASTLGLLRWQHPYARWSFAVGCWALAVIVLALARIRKQRRH